MDMDGHARFGVSRNKRSRTRDYLVSHLLKKLTEGNEESGQRYAFDAAGFRFLEVSFVNQYSVVTDSF